MRQIIDNIDPNIDLGGPRCDLSPHSLRKGADTYVINQVCGPNESMVKLQAGHSLGNVQRCYQKENPYGDCIVGRILAGIPMTEENCAILPPHFTTIGLDNICHDLGGFDYFIHDYHIYPDNFKRALPYMLASLIYHYKNGNLNNMLPNNHPIFTCKALSVSNDIINKLFDQINISINQCKCCQMRATGITPFVINMIMIHELQNHVVANQEILINHIKALESLIGQNPIQVLNHIKDYIDINKGTVTEGAVREIVLETITASNNLLFEKMNELHNLYNNNNNNNSNNQHASNFTSEIVNGLEGTINAYKWIGDDGQISYHPVPKKFKFESVTAQDMFQRWHKGIKRPIGDENSLYPNGICPFKNISNRRESLETTQNKKYYSQAQTIMNMIQVYATKNDTDRTDAILSPGDKITNENFETVFDYGYNKLIKHIYDDKQPTHRGQILVCSLYEIARKKKKLE